MQFFLERKTTLKIYPLKLKPVTKQILWGGTYLCENFGIGEKGQSNAEAWVMTDRPDGCNTIDNGDYRGMTLDEYINQASKAAVIGKDTDFPLLIKLIDARDRLSVQVHPDDEYALKNEGEFGKTEMWYVVDCEEGAQLIYGFNKEVSREEFERRIRDNTLPEICNFVPVHKGDVFFISAGTLHAIGAGILIAEVQQNSNTTYRVSDYGRLGVDGKPRQLHIEKALDVTRRTKPTLPFGSVGQIEKTDFGSVRQLASCRLFTTELIKLDGSLKLKEDGSFMSLLVLDGEIGVEWDGGDLLAAKGGSVFVPAGQSVTVKGNADVLLSRV